ncbi:MAG: MFS transporter [Rhizobiales bacterium]|nr:MFS transporter [Hyphomicrobiales bacterium]OJY42285.1 MAG: MFS transporter [Rhizobiales bacterium 64-17]
MTSHPIAAPGSGDQTETPYAWRRLVVCVLIGTIGNVGMWSAVVALPAMEADFGLTRASAALPYTLAMVGIALGGVMMGWMVDRFGLMLPSLIAAVALGLGYGITGVATEYWQVVLAHGLLIGMVGTATMFGPLMADVSQWFTRNRGTAVAICAAGNYLSGAVWPPVVQHFIGTSGWRTAHIGVGMFCLVTMVPLALLLRRRATVQRTAAVETDASEARASLGISPNALQILLSVSAVCCCIAMAMPQVHIVAYCGQLGYGVARGAEMLSLMFGFGVISRIASGYAADRIGGVATLLIGALLQSLALMLFLLFDELGSLYVISALFGLFQGGIVPSYAIIVREYFSPREAGMRVGIAIMASLFGMAAGGWLAGKIFDLAGSYALAFANGIGFSMITVMITAWLLLRTRRGGALVAA